MATALQLRRGTTAQNNAFTGAAGELSYDTQTEALIVHDGSTAGGFEIMPSGSIIAFGGAAAPDAGWLLCAGADISRSTYARLFAVIGTAYGTGDGSSTFGLPDLRDRVLLGKGTNNGTVGTETGSAAASSVITNATNTTGTATTGSTTAGRTNTTGTFATSAKDSATGTALTDNVNAAHTHTIPGLSIPALATTLPSSVVNFIIKI
jgi:microcystin-dependent protein